MHVLFSMRTLIGTGSIVLALIAAYLLFLLGPHLEPLWHLFQTVATPLILAMIMTYLLNPLVHALMKFHLQRTHAIILLLLLMLGIVSIIFWKGVPVFVSQVKELVEELPRIERQIGHWLQLMDGQIEQLPYGIHRTLDQVNDSLEHRIRREFQDMILAVANWFGNIFTLVVVPFLSFYFLRDVEGLQKSVYFLVPRKMRKRVFVLWRDIDRSLGQYIRGQITVSFIVGMLAGAGYYLIGLPYPLFLASIVGIMNVIPYFGPFIGAAPALLVALLTDPSLIIWVVLVNFVIQMLEGNLLGPYIVGKRLRIHPVMIIFSLLIGAEIGGVLGLILAVPVFVVLKVIIVNTVLHVRRYRTHRSDPSQDTSQD